MVYVEKAVRKVVRAAVADAKKNMFGKTRCTDLGGRKWYVEYSVMHWHEADARWGEATWDYYNTGSTQKEVFETLEGVFRKNHAPDKYAVAVSVMCDGDANSERIFLLDGSEYKKSR